MSARPAAPTARSKEQVAGRRAPVRAPSAEPARPLSVDAIHQRVWLAIVEHRLPPGTKLGEERLAKAFGVSRTQIRQVIERLAHDSIVTVHANRGAFVSSPTVEEAREVFVARRLIEHGHPLIVHDTRASAVQPLVRLGARAAGMFAASPYFLTPL